MGGRLTMGCSAQLSDDLTQQANLEKAAKRVARRPASAYMPNRELMDAPTRRSSRIEGRPAMNYSENELSAVERPERRSRLLDRHSARPDSARLLTMVARQSLAYRRCCQ